MDTSPNFFDVLGIHPAAGRLYTQHDEGSPVAVVSHGFWRKRLASDPAALGRTLQVNGRTYTLVGVLPPGYRSVMGHGVAPEIYAPAASGFPAAMPSLRPPARWHDARQARESLTGFPEEPPPVRPFSGFGAYSARKATTTGCSSSS